MSIEELIDRILESRTIDGDRASEDYMREKAEEALQEFFESHSDYSLLSLKHTLYIQVHGDAT